MELSASCRVSSGCNCTVIRAAAVSSDSERFLGALKPSQDQKWEDELTVFMGFDISPKGFGQ